MINVVIRKWGDRNNESFSQDDGTLRKIYLLMGRNMSQIIPTPSTWSTEEEFLKWKEIFLTGLKNGTRHLLLLHEEHLLGFISYTFSKADRDLHFNEIQIDSSCQGKPVVFKRLISAFTEEIKNLTFYNIRTYANSLNTRSRNLITKSGFQELEKTERGIRYFVSRDDFIYRFKRIAGRI